MEAIRTLQWWLVFGHLLIKLEIRTQTQWTEYNQQQPFVEMEFEDYVTWEAVE